MTCAISQRLAPVNCSRGAPMGRRSDRLDPDSASFTARPVPLDEGGYDAGGAYWGLPSDLYAVADSEGRVCFTRADSRQAAIRRATQ